MKITEKEIFEMEKELINNYFHGIRPREIELVEDTSFSGRADEKLQINQGFLDTCTEAELIDLLKHELIHYFLPKGRGHDEDFLEEAERVGSTVGAYEIERHVEELQPLGFIEEVFGKDGKMVEYIYHKKPQWKLFERQFLSKGASWGIHISTANVYTIITKRCC